MVGLYLQYEPRRRPANRQSASKPNALIRRTDEFYKSAPRHEAEAIEAQPEAGIRLSMIFSVNERIKAVCERAEITWPSR